jgi:hypothetical protein
MKLDPQLSIKPVAFKVLNQLRRKLVRLPRELSQKVLLAETAAWYNGRERGISLMLEPVTYRGQNTNLVIVWSEARCSDSIVVYNWPSDRWMNPPTVDHLTEEVYHAGQYFGPAEAQKAAFYIYNLVVAYAKKLEERPKEVV